MSVEGGVEAEVGPKPKQSTRECVSQEEEGNSILQVWQIPFKLCTLGVIVDLEANTSRDGLPLWFSVQPSHPLLSPSLPAPNPSQHQGLFQ